MNADEARKVIEHAYAHAEPSASLIYAAREALGQLDEARAELARRDATIAAQQPVIDAATAWVRHMEGSRHACMGAAAALIAAVDTHRAALSAPVEAGTPAEPVCGDVHRWAGYENVCVLAPHEASEASPHVCSAGTTWWPRVVEAGTPTAEPDLLSRLQSSFERAREARRDHT